MPCGICHNGIWAAFCMIYMLFIYYMFSLAVCHAPLAAQKLPYLYIFCKWIENHVFLS